MTRGGRHGDGEDGYVLITAIWLLVLAGAVVSLLMLQSLNAGRQAKTDGEILRNRLALEGAVDTIIADRVIEGENSQWSRVPAEGSVNVEGVNVQVRSTAETTRVDINNADPRLIDSTLREMGLDADARGAVLGRLAVVQGRGEVIGSLVELDALSGAAESAERICLSERFTFMPGARTVATQSVMAAGAEGGAPSQASLVFGQGQRLRLSAAGGMMLTVVARPTGQMGNAGALLDWQRAGC